MADGENPFLITAPPGLLPPARETASEPSPDTVGGDSATRRISPPREPVVARPPAVQGIPFSTPPAGPAPIAVAPPSAPVVETGDDNDETRLTPPREGRPAEWRLVLADGTTATVASAVFIGRNPARTVGDVEGELLPVDDTTKSVSKTHALVEVLEGRLWVTDLDSTNGVFVTSDGMDDVQAVPGQRTLVSPGSDIELGEFVIQVEQG